MVVAPQTFKGGLSGLEAALAIQRGILSVCPDAEVVTVPVADGGDGTLEALVAATGGRSFSDPVTGPLGERLTAAWGVMGDGATAVIEVARASGLALIPPRRRDPRITTSYGTGELIAAAVDRGYRRMIVGLGGSGTNDGGVGMAQALGIRFLDSGGRNLALGGAALSRLARIDLSGVKMGVMNTAITAATDVTNPLCGPTGASAVYGPQKGASPEVVEELDSALEQFAHVVRRSLGVEVRDVPRAGAAGGMAAGLMAFLNARVESGIDLVCRVLDLEGSLDGASLLITGEGRVDSSTVYDKAPVGVARLAKSRGIPVIIMAGSLGDGYQDVYQHGIDAVVPVLERPMSFTASVARTSELLERASERTMRLLKLNGFAGLTPPPSAP